MATLLSVLNRRAKIAEAFTKPFHKEVTRCVADYETEESDKIDDGKITDKHVKVDDRYDFRIPYIHATHESMMSSLFEKPPELIINGRGKLDELKEQKVQAIYEYLVDTCGLEDLLNDIAWWFVLVGFVAVQNDYKIEIESYEPQLGSDGQPMIDELTGEPVLVPVYGYHDPIVWVEDPLKIDFAPDSEFSLDGKKIPYYVTSRYVDVEEIKAEYEMEVEPDEELEVSGYKSKKDDEKSDLKRAKLKYYYGTLPEEVSGEVEGWAYGKFYKAIFTTKKFLHIEEADRRVKLAKLFSAPNKFFGYGIGKTLRPFQRDMSIRRGQQIRYADQYAFPWLTVNAETTVDQNALMDYKRRKPLVYSGQTAPTFLTPPNMPDTITQADQASRSDAQFVSGTLDMSKGAQDTNTVDTATGQQLFAQSADKGNEKKRKSIAKLYRAVVIDLLKSARDNWEDGKLLTITDEEGNEMETAYESSDLQDIDFDKDIDISLDNISANKDILAQRSLALYKEVKDDPMVDRRKVFSKTLREAFGIKNPDNYMLAEEEMMSQPTVDEQGNPITQDPMTTQVPGDQTLGDQLAPSPITAG